jgi:hypothetical protein
MPEKIKDGRKAVPKLSFMNSRELMPYPAWLLSTSTALFSWSSTVFLGLV